MSKFLLNLIYYRKAIFDYSEYQKKFNLFISKYIEYFIKKFYFDLYFKLV